MACRRGRPIAKPRVDVVARARADHDAPALRGEREDDAREQVPERREVEVGDGTRADCRASRNSCTPSDHSATTTATSSTAATAATSAGCSSRNAGCCRSHHLRSGLRTAQRQREDHSRRRRAATEGQSVVESPRSWTFGSDGITRTQPGTQPKTRGIRGKFPPW